MIDLTFLKGEDLAECEWDDHKRRAAFIARTWVGLQKACRNKLLPSRIWESNAHCLQLRWDIADSKKSGRYQCDLEYLPE